MRDTLHLPPSAESGGWLSALGTFTTRGNRSDPDIDRLSNAVRRARDGRILTREALTRAWGLAEDLDGMRAARPPQAARLLPAFDLWVIGTVIVRLS